MCSTLLKVGVFFRQQLNLEENFNTGSQSAEPGKPAKRQVATVAWIVLFGDAFHKFIDGISVGAAFTESLYAGFSVALAVVCEELPHEMGMYWFYIQLILFIPPFFITTTLERILS